MHDDFCELKRGAAACLCPYRHAGRPAVKVRQPRMPSDEEIREAFGEDFNNTYTSTMEASIGDSVPAKIDNIKSLFERCLRGE